MEVGVGFLIFKIPVPWLVFVGEERETDRYSGLEEERRDSLTASRSQFSTSTFWVLGLKLRHQAIQQALHLLLKCCNSIAPKAEVVGLLQEWGQPVYNKVLAGETLSQKNQKVGTKSYLKNYI